MLGFMKQLTMVLIDETVVDDFKNNKRRGKLHDAFFEKEYDAGLEKCEKIKRKCFSDGSECNYINDLDGESYEALYDYFFEACCYNARFKKKTEFEHLFESIPDNLKEKFKDEYDKSKCSEAQGLRFIEFRGDCEFTKITKNAKN